jgi:hypothetical protein
MSNLKIKSSCYPKAEEWAKPTPRHMTLAEMIHFWDNFDLDRYRRISEIKMAQGEIAPAS